jgi:threonylcarbamoyladenosine tRNA methylthiotransferase MtaB
MKVAIFTLGCKTNQYESELIRESFEIRTDKVVDSKDKADLYIINSCVVTNKAEAETRKAVSDALRDNPEAKVILTGCFIGVHSDFDRKNVILYSGDKKGIANFFYSNDLPSVDINSEQIEKFTEHTRAVVKIEEGCNNFCSYCIVPFTRGYAIKSKSEQNIVDEIKLLVGRGYKEIVLTGIEIGKYGEDLGTDLSELLKKLKKIEELKRLRISSIHPKYISDELINEIDYPIVPHLHISLQSGDNSILKKMNRGYTREDYLNIVKRFRSADANFSISTDIIVGFPDESQDAFFNSIDIVRQVQFSKVHIFRFSKRPFTPAFYMKETAPESLKKARAMRLKDVVDIEQKAYKELFLGKIVNVLVEELNDGYLTGFTPYYLKVKFKGDFKSGDFADVLVERVDSEFMYGKSAL